MNSNPQSPYKLSTRWKITGILTTRSPLHIGSGGKTTHPDLMNASTKEPIEVSAIERDHCGNPVIPGASLKGVLRAWAEKCKKDATRIFGGREKDADAGLAEFPHACLIAPSRNQEAQYEANLPYWRSELRTGIVSHVCIDRLNGTAQDQKLFFEEFLPEGLSFQVEIFAERLAEEEIRLLLAILEHGTAHDTSPLQFGANGANGWGRMTWTLTSIERAEPNDVQFDAATLSFRQGWLPVNLTALPPPTIPSSIETIPISLQCPGAFLVNDKSRTHQAENDNRPHFTPLRRADGGVWLPASSFRGVLRQRAEFILRSLDSASDNSLIEQIFGTTERASRLIIEEFTEVGRCSTNCHQDFVAIDRFTGGAADGAKFDAQYADQPTVTSQLLLDTTEVSPAASALLAAALRDVMRGDVCFGFGGSKGYGEFQGSWDAASETWAKDLLKHLPAAKPTNASTVGPSVSPANSTAIEGKLIYQDTKSGKVRRIIYPTKKGPSIPTPFDDSLLSPSLRTDKTPEIEVEFDGHPPGKLKQIRRRGERPTVAAKHALTPDQARGRFAHAYYFLRQEERKANWPHDLADRPPVGHNRYVEDCFSGTIRVRLTTETPLLLCDDSTREELSQGSGHFLYHLRVDTNNRPILHASSVRGMLRAAYEAITNSRFGVFPGKLAVGNAPAEKHGRRLGFRREAKVDIEPAYIEEATADRVVIRILRKRWANSPAKLRRYETTAEDNVDKGESVAALRYPDNTLPQNGDDVFVQVSAKGRVNAIRPAEGELPADWLRGWVLITGANINNKQYERVFVLSDRDEVVLHEGVEATRVHTLWSELITNYQEIHTRDLKQRENEGQPADAYLGDEPGRTAWSRHVYEANTQNLLPGTLLYIRRESNKIVDLFPVSISRKLHAQSPLRSLPKSLQPAPDRSQLSPADRVFGWVSQIGSLSENPAYRSKLRLGVVECATQNPVTCLDTPLVLPILAQPKPSQGRFYVGDQQGRTQQKGGTKKDRGYTEGNRIRGPKMYPHHSQFSLRRLTNPPHFPSNQNRSITGYVREGVEFTFDLKFLNLSRTELAALVWLLSLPEDHFLRLGLGKPLGFGSVRVTIDPNNTCVADGREWIANLREWDMKPNVEDLKPLVAEYEEIINEVNPSLLPSFLQIAKGFGEVEVMYPPNPDDPREIGNHFKWFAANESSANAMSLPDPLDADPLLPTDPRQSAR